MGALYLGVNAGLSAAGISSGLAALGSVTGGEMIVGVTVAGAIPIVAGTAGFGIIRGIRRVARERRLNVTERDDQWEMEAGHDAGETE